jgi:uncharacterized protein YndB with AHSA1/START domain
MTTHETPAPVRKTLTVALPPAEAFALFTQDLPRWWPMARYSILEGTHAGFEFGQRSGAEVCEIGVDGRRHRWATITEWDPPRAFALAWHPGREASQATRLRVEFAPAAAGTEVRLHHDGWQALGDDAAGTRGRYDGGWQLVLDAFARGAAPPPR